MVLAIVIGVLAVILTILFRQTRFYKLASKLPTAKGAPLIGHALDVWVDPNELLQRLIDILNRKENKEILKNKGILAFWVGPIVAVVVENLPDIEQILASRTLIRKSYQYKFFEPWVGQGLFTSSGPHWNAHRKLITHAFHVKVLENCIPIFNSNIEIYLKKLDSKVEKGSFNIESYVTNLSLDIIAETAMSAKINAQLGESEYAEKVKDMTEIILLRAFRPFYYPEIIFNLSALGKKHTETKKYIDKFIGNIVSQKKREREIKEVNLQESSETGGKTRMALMDLLLENQSKSYLLSDKDILDEVNTFMFGGHDTVASAINFTLYLLSRHPVIQEEILKEILMIVGDGQFTLSNLQELKYLERVIKESLRILPVAPFIARSVDHETKLPSGYTVPAGATILIFIYKLHRNPDIFPNPEEFDPDRFLPENCAERHPYSYLPFSAGPRNCIGQKFALLEMKAVIAATVRRFKLLPTGQDVKPVAHVILRSASGINLVLEKRHQKQQDFFKHCPIFFNQCSHLTNFLTMPPFQSKSFLNCD